MGANTQNIGIGFNKPVLAVRSFAERPGSVPFVPELCEKEFIDGAVQICRERVISGSQLPVLPNGDATIAVRIDMAVGFARDTPADLDDSGLAPRETSRDRHFDLEFTDRACGVANRAVLKNQVGAKDADTRPLHVGPQLGLLECDRSSNFFQRQDASFSYDFAQGFDCEPAC